MLLGELMLWVIGWLFITLLLAGIPDRSPKPLTYKHKFRIVFTLEVIMTVLSALICWICTWNIWLIKLY
jgi:hypothetical protein